MGDTDGLVPRAAAGAVVIRDGQILLVKRSMPPNRNSWVVPSGRVEFGETWRDAARRETREETGLRIEVGDVAWVGEVIEGSRHFAIVDFFATITGGELKAGSDAAEVRWVPLDEATGLDMPASMYDLMAHLRS